MRTMTLLTILMCTMTAQAQKPGDPSPEPPPEGPITARLVAKKSTYVLDRKGRTAAQYAAALQAGGADAVAIDVVLEFENNTKEPIDLRITGAVPKLSLILKGKQIVAVQARREGRKPVTYATIKPGAKYEMPLTALAGYATSAQETRLYWVEPGEYTLQAEFTTVTRGLVALPAAGVAARMKTNKLPPIVTDPITLTVKAK